MKMLMLCREPRLYSCQRLLQACCERGIELDILDPNRMMLQLGVENGRTVLELFYQEGEHYDKHRPEPRKLPEYVAILPRFGTTSTEMGCNVLKHFESKGVAVLNSATSFQLARNKWQSLQALVAQAIPVPSSFFMGELVSVASGLNLQKNDQNTPLVIKTLSGSQGVGVMLAESQASGLSLLETLRQANVPTLTQHFVKEAKGQDIRAFVIGEQVVAAMQRTGKADDFRANLHQGGTATAITLSMEEQALAVQATKAIGLDIAGVDFIRSANGLLVLEVNASPGLEGIESVSQKDIAGMMIDYLCHKKRC